MYTLAQLTTAYNRGTVTSLIYSDATKRNKIDRATFQGKSKGEREMPEKYNRRPRSLEYRRVNQTSRRHGRVATLVSFSPRSDPARLGSRDAHQNGIVRSNEYPNTRIDDSGGGRTWPYGTRRIPRSAGWTRNFVARCVPRRVARAGSKRRGTIGAKAGGQQKSSNEIPV